MPAGVRFVTRNLFNVADALNIPLPLRARIGLERPGTLQKIALVAPDLSFVYITVPKAANSTIKRTLFALYDKSPPESNLEALHASAGPYRTISQLSRTEINLAFRHPQSYRFTFVRNPYARLLSAYWDKIIDCNRRDYGNRYAKKLKLSANATFEQFVLGVSGQPDRASDWHWMSQTRCTMLNLVDYSFVGRVESLAEDLAKVLSIIGRNSYLHEPVVHLNRTAEQPSGNIYTKRVADIVFRRYQDDFANFQYDRESWRTI
jgi:hypothetical protein